MFSGIESLKEEIKTFVKIKKVNIPPQQNYLTISKTNNTILCQKESYGIKNTYSYEFSKIFSESDDYSNIFRDITINCINDCIQGYNYSFISYGESNSEKHDLLFCDYLSNKKGIFPRLCKQLINIRQTFSISLMFVYENKIFDINDIIDNMEFNNDINLNKKNRGIDYIKSIMDFGIIIQQNFDIIKEIKKIKIKNLEEFYKLLNKYKKFFQVLQNENLSETNFNNLNREENKYPYIFTASNFIYVIYLYNQNNNDIISKISFIEFASNDNLITKNNKLNSSAKDFMFNTKNFIKNSNITESFIVAMKKLKILENIAKSKDINNYKNDELNNLNSSIIINNKNQIELDFKDGMDNKFVLLCQKLCFNSIKTKFRVIGCIYPNVGFNNSTMDTLNFLYDFQKVLMIKTNNLHNLEKYDIDASSIKNEEKDSIIANLRNDCSTLKKTISELRNHVDVLIEKNHKLKIKHKKNIDIIKEKLGFKGDINLLIRGGPMADEMPFVKEIKENKEMLMRERFKIEELEKENESIRNENKKMKKIYETRLDTITMINYFNDNIENSKDKKYIKEKNEQEKLILSLRNENNKLKQILLAYKFENSRKGEIIQKFPEIFNLNLMLKNKIKQKQSNKNLKENKMNKSMYNMNNIIKEIKKDNQLDDNIGKIFDVQNYELLKYISDKEIEKKKLLKEKNSILKESILFYKLIMNIFLRHLSLYKNIQNLKNEKYEIYEFFEEYDKMIKEAKDNINYYSFPITLKEIEKEKTESNNNIFKIESDAKIINNLPYGDLLLKYKKSLDYIDELKNENKRLYEKLDYLSLKEQNKNNIIIDNEKSNKQLVNNINNTYRKNVDNIKKFFKKSFLFRNNSFVVDDKKYKLNKSKSFINDKLKNIQDISNSLINEKNSSLNRKIFKNINKNKGSKTGRFINK